MQLFLHVMYPSKIKKEKSEAIPFVQMHPCREISMGYDTEYFFMISTNMGYLCNIDVQVHSDIVRICWW